MKRCLFPKLLLLAVAVVLLAPGSAAATSISIANWSFEAPILVPPGPVGQWNYTVQDWVLTGTGGTWSPIPPYYSSVPDGAQISWLHAGSLSQTLTATLTANYTYTLEASVSRWSGTPTYRVQLLTEDNFSVEHLLAETTGTASFRSFDHVQVVYTPSGTDPYLGQNLKVKLVSSGSENDYDKIVLNYVPLPSTVLLLISGLVGLGFLGRRRRGSKK